MKRSLILALFLMAVPASAFANSCPSIMAEIDAAMAGASISEADMTKVKELRARGEAEHQAGDHGASVATLEEAKELLGI